jgi:3-dehydroquinate dehydratase / shikimate dehydrogenase
MADKRICISLMADSMTALVERIRSSAGQTDLIEVRFDCLPADELGAHDIHHLQSRLKAVVEACRGTETITTFRPREFGGCREISAIERLNFWSESLATGIQDLEEDLFEHGPAPRFQNRICSFHDFEKVPDELDSIFERLTKTGAEMIKIAVKVEDATDAIPVWKLLERSNPRTRVIPIAMGEAGKWTRILGLAFGAPITYASPAGDAGTAPGQISIEDLKDTFRADRLDRDTLVFGVVAGDTRYSLSPYMHNAAFAVAAMNAAFIPFQVSDLAAFIRRMIDPDTRETGFDFRGLAVTNPHKQTVMALLDEIDPTAGAIGAVNTVKIDGKKLTGFNTDAEGFLRPLQQKFPDLVGARAAVVGSGGAARACVHALKGAGASVVILARDVSRALAFTHDFDVEIEPLAGANKRRIAADILVNATPTGTRGPHANTTVATADELRDVKLVYDLVYNPTDTLLIREARAAGAQTLGGLEMLIAQGALQFEIWTGRPAPVSVMRAAVEKRLQ